jgi:3-oxoacyl-[acyl-carrier protein] reductase
MDLGLASRTYIVTGGTRGLGFAVARVLVDDGANVIVASRDERHVAGAVERLGKSSAHGVVADLTDVASPARLILAAHDRFGGLHGAFVSHGGPPPGTAAELDDETLREGLELAVVAPIRVVREIARELTEANLGSIVLLTSSSSAQPIGGLASSNVARPGAWGYVKTLADELAPRGIRVNAVLPGRFATERVEAVDAYRAERGGISPQEARAESERSIPLGRLGDPLELGKVAAFLLSPAASYVTGSAWAVDGGMLRAL